MSELNLATKMNLPVEMFEEVFKNLTPSQIIQLASLNRNARQAVNRIIQRMMDSVYKQYATSMNIMISKRLNKFWAVQVCNSTSDGQSKMFYKVNLWMMIRTQISESRFIDMAYPKIKQ